MVQIQWIILNEPSPKQRRYTGAILQAMSAEISDNLPILTVRESLVVKAINAGVKESEAIKLGGWGNWAGEHPGVWLRDHPAVLATISHLRETILFDAAEVLRELIRQYAGLIVQEARLEGMLGHDIGDLYSVSGALLPVKDWPEQWRTQLVVEIQTKEEFGRSDDGRDGEKRGGWDKEADVKNLKRESTLAIERELRACKKQQVEVLELMMQHKAVDAKAAAKQDVNVNLSVEVNRRLSAALEREAALKIIDVKAE